ncbi:MAG: glutathione S-transferase N-terminal domain-containing protein [Gammaproteobacteria bacterium]|nr:glutathione S-transferase N-terminal domain-containing protein [Gammaproteobacteria bacterium]
MLLKLLRNGLGSIIVFIDWVTRPAKMERSPEQQQLVENQLKEMTIYQLYACPFCIKTRRALRRLNLPMEVKSVSMGSPYREELEKGGGRIQVPCLRLQSNDSDVWMYESADIINYLEKQFGQDDLNKIVNS